MDGTLRKTASKDRQQYPYLTTKPVDQGQSFKERQRIIYGY